MFGLNLIVPSIMQGFAEFMNTLAQMLYLIGSVLLLLLDFVQDIFRRLAGLKSDDVGMGEGDILLEIFKSDAVMDAFTSLVIVGILLLFLFTIIQFIRIEYTAEGAKNSRGNIVAQALKSLVMFLIVPVVCGAGILLSNQLLRIIDNATSGGAGPTVSGQIFKIAAYNANPIRAGESKIVAAGNAIHGHEGSKAFQRMPFFMEIENYDYKLKLCLDSAGNEGTAGAKLGTYKVNTIDHVSGLVKAPVAYINGAYTFLEGDAEFSKQSGTGPSNKKFTYRTLSILPNFAGAATSDEELAERLDVIFSLKTSKAEDDNGSLFYMTQIKKNDSINYTNSRAVFYFYNINDMNFFLMYLAGWFALKSLLYASFGLIMRLYMATILFIISPPVIAMAPMDNGKALSQWRGKFVGQVISAYGIVVGLNIFFKVVVIIQNIELFSKDSPSIWANMTAGWYNSVFQMLAILVGCLMIKNINSVISQLFGADDALSAGTQMKKEVDDTVKKAASTAGRVGGMIATGGAVAIGAGMSLNARIQASNAYRNAGVEEKMIEEQKLGERDAAKSRMDAAKSNLRQELNESSQRVWGRNYNELEENERAVVKEDLRIHGSLNDFKDSVSAYKTANLDYELAKEDTLKAKQEALADPDIQKMYLKGETMLSRGRNVAMSHFKNVKPLKAFNDYTGNVFTAQGRKQAEQEFAGRNYLTQQIMKNYDSERSTKEEKDSIKAMGIIARSIESSNEISLNKAVTEQFSQNIALLSGSQRREVDLAQDSIQSLADVFKRANEKEYEALDRGDQLGVNRVRQERLTALDAMQKIMGDLIRSGSLSQDSQVTLSNALNDLDANRITIDEFKTQIESKAETRVEAIMKDEGAKEEMGKLKEVIKSDSIKAMTDAISDLEKRFANGGVRLQSVEEIKDALTQAMNEQKSQTDLIKKLGESAKK